VTIWLNSNLVILHYRLRRVGFKFLNLHWVGLGESDDGSGRVGLDRVTENGPRTTTNVREI